MGKRTQRNEMMYHSGGFVYAYFCYGVHVLFNITLNKVNIPDVVLIRALEPVKGKNIMRERMGIETHDKNITKGPGNLSKAMGINISHNGTSLNSDIIYLEDNERITQNDDIIISPRIGVQGAGKGANLPYRFFIKGNPFVSSRKSFFQYQFL